MAVEKAGTILLNLETRKVALVFRDSYNDYSFPKGHVEKNENFKQCAVRETEEETLRANHLLIHQEVYISNYTTLYKREAECRYFIAVDDGPTTKNIDPDDREVLHWYDIDEVEDMLSYTDLKDMWKKIKTPITKILDNGGTISPEILTDLRICPTCYDRKNNHSLYGDNSDKFLYENLDFECFLCSNPRVNGHTIILSKPHYKDMMETPSSLCESIFDFAKYAMNAIKKIYNCESVYLCTMCDGPINHFHVQLIPRYSWEERGSKNFVKPRKEYTRDGKKIEALKEELHKYNLS